MKEVSKKIISTAVVCGRDEIYDIYKLVVIFIINYSLKFILFIIAYIFIYIFYILL